MKDYLDRKLISDFTRAEFLDFVRIIGDVPWDTEEEDVRWIQKFRSLANHPKGTDLLFYPEPGKESDEAVVEEVERYRREMGLPGFKDS